MHMRVILIVKAWLWQRPHVVSVLDIGVACDDVRKSG